MRYVLAILTIMALGGVAPAAGRGTVDTSASPHVKLRSVPMDAVKWTTGFWGDLLYRPLKPRAPKRPKSGTVEITLIPYYAWANRGLSLMEVWIPLARQSGNR